LGLIDIRPLGADGFVSAKAVAVIQFVALSFYRFEPSAILGQYGQSSLASCLMVGMTLGFENA
jgi:hypothetical protein